MRFPLSKRIKCGYSFWQWTFYKSNHLGQDYTCSNWYLYAPTDGEVLKYVWGNQGGNWLYFKDSKGKIWRFAHLSKLVKSGRVKEGDKIAITGNTGSASSGAHLHIDIWRGRVNWAHATKSMLYNPETYIKQGDNMVSRKRFNKCMATAASRLERLEAKTASFDKCMSTAKSRLERIKKYTSRMITTEARVIELETLLKQPKSCPPCPKPKPCPPCKDWFTLLIEKIKSWTRKKS